MQISFKLNKIIRNVFPKPGSVRPGNRAGVMIKVIQSECRQRYTQKMSGMLNYLFRPTENLFKSTANIL